MQPGWKSRALGVLGVAGAVVAALSLVWILVEIFHQGSVGQSTSMVFAASIAAATCGAVHFATESLASMPTAAQSLAEVRERCLAMKPDQAAGADAVVDAATKIVSAAARDLRPARPAPRSCEGRGAVPASAA